MYIIEPPLQRLMGASYIRWGATPNKFPARLLPITSHSFAAYCALSAQSCRKLRSRLYVRHVTLHVRNYCANQKTFCTLLRHTVQLQNIRVITGPPAHSVGARRVTVAGVCRRL